MDRRHPVPSSRWVVLALVAAALLVIPAAEAKGGRSSRGRSGSSSSSKPTVDAVGTTPGSGPTVLPEGDKHLKGLTGDANPAAQIVTVAFDMSDIPSGLSDEQQRLWACQQPTPTEARAYVARAAVPVEMAITEGAQITLDASGMRSKQLALCRFGQPLGFLHTGRFTGWEIGLMVFAGVVAVVVVILVVVVRYSERARGFVSKWRVLACLCSPCMTKLETPTIADFLDKADTHPPPKYVNQPTTPAAAPTLTGPSEAARLSNSNLAAYFHSNGAAASALRSAQRLVEESTAASSSSPNEARDKLSAAWSVAATEWTITFSIEEPRLQLQTRLSLNPDGSIVGSGYELTGPVVQQMANSPPPTPQTCFIAGRWDERKNAVAFGIFHLGPTHFNVDHVRGYLLPGPPSGPAGISADVYVNLRGLENGKLSKGTVYIVPVPKPLPSTAMGHGAPSVPQAAVGQAWQQQQQQPAQQQPLPQQQQRFQQQPQMWAQQHPQQFQQHQPQYQQQPPQYQQSGVPPTNGFAPMSTTSGQPSHLH